MSWEDIVRKGLEVKQNGGVVTIEDFESRVEILKWEEDDGTERDGQCMVNWSFQIVPRENHIREMGVGVKRIIFDDGTVFDDEIQTDVSGKAFAFGNFIPDSVYKDKLDETPMVSFDFR